LSLDSRDNKEREKESEEKETERAVIFLKSHQDLGKYQR
jgi:hypothetical protein